MPKIDREHIGVAFDMQGCPNRCRHCWLGSASNQKLSEQDVRWGVAQFRDIREVVDAAEEVRILHYDAGCVVVQARGDPLPAGQSAL